MKAKLLLMGLVFTTSIIFSQNEFITTWKTDNPGTSNDTSITIPTNGAGYNYDVDWNNDGVFDEFGLTGNVIHDFTSIGTYTIRIQGAFPRIYFNNSGDKQKIISIDQWGTIAWSSMERAFFGASNLAVNATDAPDLSAVTAASYMFFNATTFNQDISDWDMSNVTNIYAMFGGATSYNNGGQALDWNLTGVTNMGDMFNGAIAFNQDLSSWDISNVTYLNNMFVGATAYNNGGLPLNWNLTGLTDAGNMFYGASAFNQDISTWDMSTVTNVGGMFGEATAFNQDLSAWDISNISSFGGMFYDATSYNNGGQPLNWNTTGKTNFSNMFSGATAFNQDISAWDTSSVTNMTGMLRDTDAFNQDLSAWDISNVTSFDSMFLNAAAYNNGGQPLNWNTTGLTNFTAMFASATAFNQDISGWDISSVTSFAAMFQEATSFNNGGMPLNWDTSNVTDMSWMFYGATSFDQNIGGWNVENVTNFYDMLDGATLSQANYDALLIGWDAQNLSPNELFDAGNSQYCSVAAQNARTHMVELVAFGGHGWGITDGGLYVGTCDVLDIEDNELDNLLIYPNPTKGNVTISLNSSASYSLVSMLGQEIQKGSFNFGDNTLDISNISKGLYILNVKTGNGKVTKKIIKK